MACKWVEGRRWPCLGEVVQKVWLRIESRGRTETVAAVPEAAYSLLIYKLQGEYSCFSLGCQLYTKSIHPAQISAYTPESRPARG